LPKEKIRCVSRHWHGREHLEREANGVTHMIQRLTPPITRVVLPHPIYDALLQLFTCTLRNEYAEPLDLHKCCVSDFHLYSISILYRFDEYIFSRHLWSSLQSCDGKKWPTLLYYSIACRYHALSYIVYSTSCKMTNITYKSMYQTHRRPTAAVEHTHRRLHRDGGHHGH